jgi:folate-binding protein YgfZ
VLTLDRAQCARKSGLFLRPEMMPDPYVWVHVVGPDAARFLHSQTTNEVVGLGNGAGNMGARVSRTGHLASLFSVHRFPDEDGEHFGLLLPVSQQAELVGFLDSVHFSDVLTLSASQRSVAVLQGPTAGKQLTELGGMWAAVDWEAMHECALVKVGDSCVVKRSLTGDPGFLIESEDPSLWERLSTAVQSTGGVVGTQANDALLALHLEAGWPTIGPDTVQKRLLPETGIEQHTVSYTKGCYLGQEVIARVRTYGSLPKALRVLVFESQRKGAAFTLAQIPAPGEAVVLADGNKAGHFGSRALSPTMGCPIAFAYLKKASRTPGTSLTIWGERGPMKATVRLAPLYTAADQAAAVAQLYDEAIRIFAEGDEDGAMRKLDAALRIDPSFADAYEAIGVIFGRQGKYHEAIDFFRRLEEVAPLAPMVNTNLSLYYMKLGDKETAEAQSALAARKSMRGGRETVDAAEVAAAQTEARQADARRKKGMFEQVLDFDPDDPIALFGIGSALCILQSWETAVGYLQRASTVDRRNSAVYLAWGKALEALEQSDEAIAVYTAGVEVASGRGDLMPLKEMASRLLLLRATSGSLE